jgi:hypothetical protein
MTMSPGSRWGTSASSTLSTTPAGTMIQIARGRDIFAASSCSEAAPAAPCSTSAATAAGRPSWTTHGMPWPSRRRTMLAPMRPKPIIPSCIAFSC